MMVRDAGMIMEKVVKHLTSLYGAKVKATLEIEAELPNGVSRALSSSSIFAEKRVDSVLLSGYTGRRRTVKHKERGKQP
jgi:shikimate kinase